MKRLATIGALWCGLALGYVSRGVAEAFSRCPDYWECRAAAEACHRGPYRRRYECLTDVRINCVSRCIRCGTCPDGVP